MVINHCKVQCEILVLCRGCNSGCEMSLKCFQGKTPFSRFRLTVDAVSSKSCLKHIFCALNELFKNIQIHFHYSDAKKQNAVFDAKSYLPTKPFIWQLLLSSVIWACCRTFFFLLVWLFSNFFHFHVKNQDQHSLLGVHIFLNSVYTKIIGEKTHTNKGICFSLLSVCTNITQNESSALSPEPASLYLVKLL